MQVDLTKVDNIISEYKTEQGLLISMLQDIQAEFNYLPKETLLRVSEKLDIPASQVFSVATFFKAFSLKPRGRHVIHVCTGTACHVRGAKRIVDKLQRDLEISAGETTSDLEFTLETVNCVGSCALGPMVVLDGEYHGQMNMEKTECLVKDLTWKK